jgi:hypothetical protein
VGGFFIFEQLNPITEKYELSTVKKRTAVVAINRNAIALPTQPVSPKIFDYLPIRDGIIPITEGEAKKESEKDYQTVRITAKRMTIVSRKEIQFQNAKFYVGEQKVLSQQLF